MYAAEEGHAEIVKMLMEAGSNIHHVDNVSNFVQMECLLTYITYHMFLTVHGTC